METKKIQTKTLMSASDRYTQALRNERPIFIRFKDGKLIKHALTHLTEFELETLFWWFLVYKKICAQPFIIWGASYSLRQKQSKTIAG